MSGNRGSALRGSAALLGLGCVVMHFATGWAGALSQNPFVSLSPVACLGAVFGAEHLAPPETCGLIQALGYVGIFSHPLLLAIFYR